MYYIINILAYFISTLCIPFILIVSYLHLHIAYNYNSRIQILMFELI